MPKSFLALSGHDKINYTGNPDSQSLRAVVITADVFKFGEFIEQLGHGYGMDIKQYADSSAISTEMKCLSIMQNMSPTPHYILREKTTLTEEGTGEDLTHLSLAELKTLELTSVIHRSKLDVYIPKWDKDLTRPGGKKFIGFNVINYEKSTNGYIKPGAISLECKRGFGWDALFVNAATNLTNEEYFERYGKKSARQHVISDFIESDLRYKCLKALRHHSLPLTEPIQFGNTYIALTDFVQNEPHLSNPYLAMWGTDKLRNSMINQGLFIKAAWSRVVKNYFLPPFSGLPLTAKKDSLEETIFMIHDMMHHLIPDLICDNGNGKKQFNVYSAWRMCSEACTLVLADMLYADGLVRADKEQHLAWSARDKVDQRIYGLFEAVKEVQGIDDPARMPIEEKNGFIKKLLHANVQYALLGNDTFWQSLLQQPDGSILDAHLETLNAYKNHFEKFFIGDHVWTRANFENMHQRANALNTWISQVGQNTLRQANVPLLSDICSLLESNGHTLSDYGTTVDAVFDCIFHTRIEPIFNAPEVQFESNEVIQSRAFQRFLIGQSSLFSRFPEPPNLKFIPKAIYSRLKSNTLYTSDEQDNLRALIRQYISGIKGMGLMTREEALNARDCIAVFPPVYISYQDMQKKYGSIKNCVAQHIDDYQTSSFSATTNVTKVINDITFIDVQALESTVGKYVPTKHRLREKMIRLGVEFWDEEKTIVKTPKVGITSVGGFLICLESSLPSGCIRLRLGDELSEPILVRDLVDGLAQGMGAQSLPTYQNPHGKSPKEMYEITTKLQHLSIGHAAMLGFQIYGLSGIAEREFDVQRDLVHLARETSARAECQDEPCFYAADAESSTLAKEIRQFTIQLLAEHRPQKSTLNLRESLNSLYPNATCLSLGINGTLRSLGKMVADLGNSGKEREYRMHLKSMNDMLYTLFPMLFSETAMYEEKLKKQTKSPAAAIGFYAPTSSQAIQPKTAMLLLGAPCVGKSTQTTELKKRPGIMCISTGELVRALDAKTKTNASLSAIEQQAAQSLNIMRQGGLMDADAVYALLMDYLSQGEGLQQYMKADTIILDGVIKSTDDLSAFERAMQRFNAGNKAPMALSTVINLVADNEALIARNQMRALQTGYSRADDDAQIYQKRLNHYLTQTSGILRYYQDKQCCMCNVDGMQSVDAITEELIKITSPQASAACASSM